jgi:hypothetical protein
VFIIGPTLVAGLGTVAGPRLALLAAAAVTTAGLIGLAASGPARPVSGAAPVGGRPAAGGWLNWGGLIGQCAVFLTIGWVFAAVQVTAFSFTAAHGAAWQAGPLLVFFSVISLAAGVAAGLRPAAGSALRRHRAVLLLLAVGLLPAVFAGTALTLAGLLIPAAIAASPAVATGFARAAELASPDRTGEALAWSAAALGAGLALGNLGNGALADGAGSRGVLIVAAAVAALGAVTAGRAAGVTVPGRVAPAVTRATDSVGV